MRIAGMLPLARELLRRGTAVVLAANSVPSINDVTAAELAEVAREAASLDKVLDRALAEGTLQVMPSGNDLPVIDLRRVRRPIRLSEQRVEHACRFACNCACATVACTRSRACE